VSDSTANLKAAEKDDAAFREDFLRAVSHIGLSRDTAAALVETCSGRPFSVCGATDLLLVVQELLPLVRRATAHVSGGPACAE
jgi:hypothetical protein